MDGSLGSGTAVMFEAFTDEPGNRGVYAAEAIPLSALEERVAGADAAGLQVEVHAIGDRANAEILDIYERVEKQNGPRDRRFRIEHAQHLRAADIPRFAELGVIASMQPYHAVDDGRWAMKRLGEARPRTLARSVASTTRPRSPSARTGTSRRSRRSSASPPPSRARTIDGKKPGGWVPEQKISVEEALRAYTVSAAYAGFDEKEKGSLESGKLADFVILSGDVLSVRPEELDKIQVDTTVVGGRVVYSRQPRGGGRAASLRGSPLAVPAAAQGPRARHDPASPREFRKGGTLHGSRRSKVDTPAPCRRDLARLAGRNSGDSAGSKD